MTRTIPIAEPGEDRDAAAPNITALAVGRRLCRVAAVLLLFQLRALPSIVPAHWRGRTDQRNRLVGEALAGAAERLGPVFVKAAQMLSYRTDLLPDALLAPIARLQEHVAPPPAGISQQTVERALGAHTLDIFTDFETEPIACGSVATVHRATTRDGDAVAVKIVRPDVRGEIARDLACLQWMVARLARLPAAAGIPVVEVFDTIARMIEGQANMIEEARNLRALRQAFVDLPGVAIPRARTEIALTRDLLVMDFVADSIPMTAPAIPSDMFKAAARKILQVVYRMIFVERLVHCDLHPGNVRIAADGTAYLLDAGLAARLTQDDCDCFRNFFVALAKSDAAGVADAIIRSAADIPADFQEPAFAADVAALVAVYAGRTAGSFLIVEFVCRVFALQRKYRLRGAPGFVTAIWALIMFEGIVRDRYPELDFQAEARPFAIASLLRTRQPSRRATG